MAIARRPRGPGYNHHDNWVVSYSTDKQQASEAIENIIDTITDRRRPTGSILRHAQNDYWATSTIAENDLWAYSKKIREYEVVDAYDELVRHWKNLPRPEIMVPRQQTIESRWQSEKPYIFSIHGGSDDIELGLRGKLAGAAMMGGAGSYSGGMLSWALSAPGAVSAGIAAAVGTGGAGYFLYKNRKKAPEEPSDAVKADMEKSRVWRLFPEQRKLLTETFSYMGIPAGYRNGYGETELDQTLSIIDAPDHALRAKQLLEWIDKSNYNRAWQSAYRSSRSDAEKAWDYLDEFSHSINFTADVTDAFSLDTWPQVPLTIQALIRMHKRGAFMDEYEDEFIAIQETQARMSEIQEEMVIVGQTAIALRGSNIKYFEMQRKALDDEFETLKKEVILFDLRMAALAYVYETGDKNALDTYSPTVSEKARGDQVELWRESIDALCEMPISEVSSAMGTVIIGTVNKLISIDQSNPLHGSVAKSIADYVHKIAPHIRDEGAALEAMRRIDELLSRN